MKNIVRKMTAALTMIVMLGSFVVVDATPALAANTDAVGTVDVSVQPKPQGNSTEYVEIKFTGTGTLQLDGWTLSDTVGVQYTYGTETLSSGDTFVVCDDSTKSVVCDAEWTGGSVWNDGGDSLILKR